MRFITLCSFLLITGSLLASLGCIAQSDTLPAQKAMKQNSSSTRLAPQPMIMPGIRLDTTFNNLPAQNPVVGKAAPAWLRARTSGLPMYIVDGKSATATQLKSLRKTDVASMNILDGSRATTLYGKNARNGMVIITTKKAVNR